MVELLSALVWVRRHGEAFVNGTRELMAMPGLVAHACNPSTPETGTGGPP